MNQSIHTREEIIEMLSEYTKAERAILTGKSYKIGTRELTRIDIDEIRKGRAYWENELNKMNSKERRRVKIGVFRSI